METNELQISRNIKAQRNKKGYTQQDVADILKVSKATYLDIENKPLKRAIGELMKLADIFECTLDDFF